MKEPYFLSKRQIERLHDIGLRRYGGAQGLRDEGLFESAASQPLNDYHYAGADLYGIAAAYAFHISQAQAFLDGNKRTAAAAALVFLEINGVNTDFNSELFYDAMILVAEGKLKKADLAAILRDNLQK